MEGFFVVAVEIEVTAAVGVKGGAFELEVCPPSSTASVVAAASETAFNEILPINMTAPATLGMRWWAHSQCV
jgi:hypothetical protein